MTSIDILHLFKLRVAATLWLQQHPDDPNASDVRRAIEAAEKAESRGIAI